MVDFRSDDLTPSQQLIRASFAINRLRVTKPLAIVPAGVSDPIRGDNSPRYGNRDAEALAEVELPIELPPGDTAFLSLKSRRDGRDKRLHLTTITLVPQDRNGASVPSNLHEAN